MESLLEFITGLFKDLRLPFRWIAIILILLLLILALFGYEQLTGHFYYGNLEKKISLLKELQLIANDGISTNRELYPIYQSTAEELARCEVRPLALPHVPSVDFADPVTWGKAISGALVYLLSGAISVSSDLKTRQFSVRTIGRATGSIVGAAILAWIGIIIPTIFNPWVNYIGFPTLQLVLFSALVLLVAPRPTGPPSPPQPSHRSATPSP